MKKKILALCLIAVLALTAVIGGSLAYFTDEDQATNTFTVGNVDITLNEQQRNDDGTALEEFEQNKELYPIVGSAQGAKDEFGLPATEEVKNFVDKVVSVTNENSDAYVRVYVAVPAALEASAGASGNALHWNVGNKVSLAGDKTTENANETYADYFEYWTNYTQLDGTTAIEGIEYNVYYFTYQKVLGKEETTQYAAIAGFYLDSGIDYDVESGKYTLNGTAIDFDLSEINIPVYAIGTQATGFASAEEAINASFGADFNPWAVA